MVAVSGAGGLAFNVVLPIVTLELLDPLLALMVATALGPFRSTLQSLLVRLRFGSEAGFPAITLASRVAKSAGAGADGASVRCGLSALQLLQLVARIMRDVVPVFVRAILDGVSSRARVGIDQVVVRPIVHPGGRLGGDFLPGHHDSQAHDHQKSHGKQGKLRNFMGFHSFFSSRDLRGRAQCLFVLKVSN